jgi:hypothetical protein
MLPYVIESKLLNPILFVNVVKVWWISDAVHLQLVHGS